jgi:hypothetical protein
MVSSLLFSLRPSSLTMISGVLFQIWNTNPSSAHVDSVRVKPIFTVSVCVCVAAKLPDMSGLAVLGERRGRIGQRPVCRERVGRGVSGCRSVW